MTQSNSRRSAVDKAIEQMTERIRDGIWPVGERVPTEQELTKDLGISRTPVREATRALVHAGLLVSRQGDGTYVAAVDAAQVALRRKMKLSELFELVEVRRGLDVSAAALAAERRKPDDLDDLRDALETRRAAAKREDHKDFRQADVAFHLAVARSTHNSLLAELYESLTDAIEESVETSGGLQRAHTAGHDDHDELFDAIRDTRPRDAMAVASAILDTQSSDLSQASSKETDA